MGYTATWAGMMAAPTGLVMVFLTPVIGALMRHIDVRFFISLGMAILAGTFFWRSYFASNISPTQVLLANAGVGIAMSCFVMPSITLAFSSLKYQEAADGNGVAAFLRTLAIAFATALVTTRWTDAAITNRSSIVDRFNGTRAVTDIGATGLPADQVLWTLDRIVQSQAVMMATNDAYKIMAAIVAGISIGIWTAPRFTVRRT
jgi:DHA2 family multidrug resistance protein